jgi:hypothetical protein
MLSLPPAVRVYLSAKPSDMRRSFDGLAQEVLDFLGEGIELAGAKRRPRFTPLKATL